MADAGHVGAVDAATRAVARALRSTEGWGFDEIAGSAIARFDRNGDGVIETPAAGGGGVQLDERVRVDEAQGATGADGALGTWSIAPLVARAEALGTRDGRATLEELERVDATFDVDHDGRIDAAERQAFVRAYGPRRITRH
jgi:hypothetical protein